MGVRHMVRRGDSLWGLAGIYLGDGARYPLIVDYHNQQSACSGPNSGLLPIEDANLIYVGQTIMVPSREKHMPPGTGTRQDGGQTATGLSCKLEYNFEGDKNPIKYRPIVTKDYTIQSEMTGKITIENLTHDGFRHNFEIGMAADKNELTSKLEFGDKTLADLTKSVETQFDIATGKVTLKATIAAKANIGPYTFEAKADAPNHFTYTFRPKPISAIVDKGRLSYKYSAEIAFKVDITLHPTPNLKEPHPVADAVREKSPGAPREKDAVGVFSAIGIIAAYILIVIYGPKGPLSRPGTGFPRYAPASNMPFLHYVDPNDPKLQS